MYQTVIPSSKMQVVGNQQANGQCPSVSSHPHSHPSNNNPADDPHQSPQRRNNTHTASAPHSNNYTNRHRMIQNNNYPIDVYQMMRVDHSVPRRSYGSGNAGNWHRRNANNSFVNTPSNVNNFRPHNNNNNNHYNNNNNSHNNSHNNNNINNNNNTSSSSSSHNNNSNNNYNNNNSGSAKKQNWNNRNSNKRNTFREQLPSQRKESNANHYNSDSGFSSRSPTPNKHRPDSQTESSDERDSIASDNKRHVKKLDETCDASSSLSFTPQVFIQSVPNVYQFFSSHQMLFYHDNINSNSIQESQMHQNYQGRKRFPINRTSPQKLQRNNKKCNTTAETTIFTNVLPRTHLAPDRYLARAKMVVVKDEPKNLYCSPKWDNLSSEIWYKFIENQQTEQTYIKKMMLWKYLYIYIKTVFPKHSVFMVGSTMNGFGCESSDVDICLVVRNSEVIQRFEAIFHLQQISAYLRQCERVYPDFIKNLDIIQAKVPILKFRDDMQNLDVDLNINNAVGVRNTHMLYCYSQIDWRVRPLVLVVKLWAQSQDINDAKNMTISSYSWALMVIHFLQCGVTPAILPCLQSMYSNKFHAHSDVHTINIHEQLDITMDQENKQSLGELFYEFLKYYVNFDFARHAVSVRLAKKVPIDECRCARTWKNNPYQWKFLCVEEPFDLTNTARSVYDYEAFQRIKTVFCCSYLRLKETRNLSSIFVSLVPRLPMRFPRAPPSPPEIV